MQLGGGVAGDVYLDGDEIDSQVCLKGDMSTQMQKELMLADEVIFSGLLNFRFLLRYFQQDRGGNKKFIRPNRPALQIYRPPGLRQQDSPQDLVADKSDSNGASPPLSIFINSNGQQQHHHHQGHHVSFVEPVGEVQTKPSRAAGQKQPYKKESRSHTSPLVGLGKT